MTPKSAATKLTELTSRTILTCVAAIALNFGPAVFAEEVSGETRQEIVSKEEFVARYDALTMDNIFDAPVAGLYELVQGTDVSYVTNDGRYLIRGEIIEIASQANLTEASSAKARAKLFSEIDPASEIVFAPEDGKVRHRIIVFTDVDCGYCRQLHRDMAFVNALGIEVDYVSYPRTGPDSESWTRAERVWCSANRADALTQAKLGADIEPTKGCSSTPVASHYEIGRRIRLAGTPGIFTPDGKDVGGYLPPELLIQRLDQLNPQAGITVAD